MNSDTAQQRFSWRYAIIAVILIFSLAMQLSLPLSREVQAAWIIGIAIVLWATGWLPEWLTAFVFFTLCSMTQVDSPDVIFAGLYSSATWLVLSGIVLGAAINFTGLGDAMASRMAPLFIGSFPRALWGSMLFGLLITFIMPSAMSRVILLIPILISLADRLGYGPGRNGRMAILLGGVLGTYLPATAILPANVPNNVLVGATEVMFGRGPGYSEYFLLHFPVLGALKIAILGMTLCYFYRDTAPKPQRQITAQKQHIGRTRLAILLVATMLLWITEPWHGISTAWIGMLAAIVCLFPHSGMINAKQLATMNMAPVFYVAGIVSMGMLAYHSGLANDLAKALLFLMPLHSNAAAQNFSVLSTLSAAMGLLVTLPGVPAVLTPITKVLAAATGWTNEAVYMAQVIGFSTVLLPYQAPPLVIAIQTGKISASDMIRVCLVTATLSILLLWPLDYLWWQILGWL
ncbi:SLC13 family permease [Brenneria populi]|uniref:SLC13 family permease n=1 Tax=Brenneria populi TaxID=1505588 RepID=A0ABU6JWW4_9GAMM|nr:SLC13 family permease [Brenneria populi Li et al. 2015]